jgi:hypothetical protein
MTTQEELLQQPVIRYDIGRALVREDELDRIVGGSKGSA